MTMKEGWTQVRREKKGRMARSARTNYLAMFLYAAGGGEVGERHRGDRSSEGNCLLKSINLVQLGSVAEGSLAILRSTLKPLSGGF